MKLLLNNIEDAVDQKYLVIKSLRNQAEAGTVIHIMGAQTGNDGITVNYRVTKTGQDFSCKFADIKQFAKWASSDNFLARYQDNLSPTDIKQYIKVCDTSFMGSGGIPILASIGVILLVLIIMCIASVIQWWQLLIGIICVPIIIYFGVTTFYKHKRNKVMSQIYNKVSASWGGVVLR
ncbi:MAG: hypothetical protein K2J36_03710 [Ruminococcus sp.]|nr:hypothetical protein [Ruminococcus sp.]MDE6672751.1 hypothetical protein [Ruminococcus sp.]MDE6797101.1 hypothetical protein [Ruminococcus sp.]